MGGHYKDRHGCSETKSSDMAGLVLACAQAEAFLFAADTHA
jgi:hypothetical protein